MRVIRFSGVGKSYRSYGHPIERLREIITRRPRHREFHALRDVNLDIQQGEVVGIVGRNGAGKSTLLKLVAGIIVPTAGQVQASGKISALLELGTGFHPEMTGRENVYTSGAIMGLTTAQITDLYDEIVAFAELDDFMDNEVKTYSSGMYARLAFAVATCVLPDILIIDEVLSVGDGAFARKSFKRLMEFKDQGSTILFCSHHLYHVEAVCNRVFWMEKGRIRMAGEPSEVVAEYSRFLFKDEDFDLSGARSKDVPEASAEVAEIPDESPEASIPAGVPDNARARLVDVQVCVDDEPWEQRNLRSGQSDLSIRVTFASSPQEPAPNVGVAITLPNGRILASAATQSDGFMVRRSSNGAGNVLIAFPRIKLLKGHYGINVYLLGDEGIHIFDRAVDIAEVRVDQQDLQRGFVFFPHDWTNVPAGVTGFG
ncbi:MAG: ABC transporter ATP-binding protein [Pseudomonadota bacterium]